MSIVSLSLTFSYARLEYGHLRKDDASLVIFCCLDELRRRFLVR
jgi:hypothetical protein